MVNDLFRFLSLGIIAAMVVAVVVNGDQTAQILNSFGGVYNTSLGTIAGQRAKAVVTNTGQTITQLS